MANLNEIIDFWEKTLNKAEIHQLNNLMDLQKNWEVDLDETAPGWNEARYSTSKQKKARWIMMMGPVAAEGGLLHFFCHQAANGVFGEDLQKPFQHLGKNPTYEQLCEVNII